MFLIGAVSAKAFPGESFDRQSIEEAVAVLVSPVRCIRLHRINSPRGARKSKAHFSWHVMDAGSPKRDIARCRKGITRLASLSAVGLPKEVLIAGVRHPMGASEMAVVDALAAFGFAGRIEAEQDLDGFLPMGAVSCRVQQAHVEFDMRPVVVGEFLPGRRDVVEFCDHGTSVIGKRSLRVDQVRSSPSAA